VPELQHGQPRSAPPVRPVRDDARRERQVLPRRRRGRGHGRGPARRREGRRRLDLRVLREHEPPGLARLHGLRRAQEREAAQLGRRDPVAAAAAPAAAPPQDAKKSGCSPAVLLAMVFMLLTCCVGSWLVFFRAQKEEATVASAAWQRTIEVEDFLPGEGDGLGQRSDRGLQGHAQAGAEDDALRPARHEDRVDDGAQQTGTKKVKTGDKDLGNGHFEEQFKDEPVYEDVKVSREVPNMVEEPVYAERYYFTIDRWRVARTAVAKGAAPAPPAWPELQLKGKEKKGKETELYLVTMKGQKVAEKVAQGSEPGRLGRVQARLDVDRRVHRRGRLQGARPGEQAAAPRREDRRADQLRNGT